MTSFFCHECQHEGNDFTNNSEDGPTCPQCHSAFVEEIPAEEAGEAVDDPRDFDPDDNPLANLFFGGGGGAGGQGGGGGQGAGGGGGQGGQPFLQFMTPSGGAGFTFATGGNGGGFTFHAGGAQGGQGAGGGAGAGLNPLTTAMLQAFGLAPPAQGFPPRATPAAGAAGGQGGEGEDAEDPEEEHAGGAQQRQQGQEGRQQVPIRNLATFLGEAFGGPPPGAHPADDPSNNPFAEGGHERGQTPDAEDPQNPAHPPGGIYVGGPLGGLFNLLSTFGLGPAQFGMAGNAGDYVFGEQNFQTLLNDLMEQAAGRAGPQPAPDDMIEKLPRVEITQELLDADSITTCGICLDSFSLSETAIALPKCHHIYHQDCLVPWLKNSGTCPTCRDALVPQPGMEGYTGPEGAGAQQAGGGEGAAAGTTTSNSTGAATSNNPLFSSSASTSIPSASTSSATLARPSLPTRHSSALSTTNPDSPSTSRIPEVDGGSSLPGGWLWPSSSSGDASASGLEEEVEDEGDRMDVDQEPERGAEREGERERQTDSEREKDPRGAAAEAAERRAREAREARESGVSGRYAEEDVDEQPVIEDVD
ncbi:hypothetical protein JCM11251_000667 [Rhodosporidiobolus azoricus]